MRKIILIIIPLLFVQINITKAQMTDDSIKVIEIKDMQLKSYPQAPEGSFMPEFIIGGLGISNSWRKIGYQQNYHGIVGSYSSYVEIKDIDYDSVKLFLIGDTPLIVPVDTPSKSIQLLEEDNSTWTDSEKIYTQGGGITDITGYSKVTDRIYSKNDRLYWHFYNSFIEMDFMENEKPDFPTIHHLNRHFFTDKTGLYYVGKIEGKRDGFFVCIKLSDLVRQPKTPLTVFKQGISYDGKLYITTDYYKLITPDLDVAKVWELDNGFTDGTSSYIWNDRMKQVDKIPYYTDLIKDRAFKTGSQGELYFNYTPTDIETEEVKGDLILMEGKLYIHTPTVYNFKLIERALFLDSEWTEPELLDLKQLIQVDNYGNKYVYKGKLYWHPRTTSNVEIDVKSARILKPENKYVRRQYIADKNEIHELYTTEENSMNPRRTGVIVNDLGERSTFMSDGKKILHVQGYMFFDKADFKTLAMVSPNILIDKNNIYTANSVVPLSELFIPIEVLNARKIRIDMGTPLKNK